MLKIAVIGGRETVMGFKALGLEACPVTNAEEARKTLRHLTRDSEDYAIIYVEENLAGWASRPSSPRWNAPSAPTFFNNPAKSFDERNDVI